ncbi:MAG: DUF1848 domain-containing protein [Bacillota bacterium]|uniref:DUF1848 family protein n=1 Tax=Thermanaerosceptrum fracticalcis TaxID=1712410 RepID=A0A7G6E739_THEFR|nr:DUF1848 domain-containing protein [Thermanaerosceptrum fracticalcis]QNB47893.1 DUF1848 family protein [Thermanaerosceptrum fracticalcis]
MIISASRRTDIPAFFGDWFIKRIEEGFFYNINPFNPRQVKGYSLLPEDVDAIVFWTKNPQPFIKHLDYLDQRGYHYYFQYTLNDYPKIFEPHVPPVHERIETFVELSKRIGKGKVIWRYDPIVISSLTPVEYHLEKIAYISSCLKGQAQRAMISFLEFYSKVNNRLKKLETQYGIQFTDFTANEHRKELLELAEKFKEIAHKNGLQIFSCTETVDLDQIGIEPGSCIDGKLIQKLFGIQKRYRKDPNQRKECLCVESVDMGVYNTCQFQCSYCYANFSEKMVHNNLNKHFKDSSSLINRYTEDIIILKDKTPRVKSGQLSLFD